MRIVAAAVLACAACSPMTYSHGVPNLAQVNASVWRSGQINSLEGWKYIQSVAGLKHVHVITVDGVDGDVIAEQLGIDVHRLPIQPRGDQDIFDDVESVFVQPAAGSITEAEKLLTSASPNDVWLVHCTHGQDRTGLVIGIYRVGHDGWTKDRAYVEMIAHNFHPELHGLHEFWDNFHEPSKGIR